MPANTSFVLLTKFEATFGDGPYRHRNSQLGNRVADRLYDDLFSLRDHGRFRTNVLAELSVLNPKSVSPGLHARRGDGSFGPLIPGRLVTMIDGSPVPRGPTAAVEIGVEVKILAKAMIKQIDRVISDLCGQARHFGTKNAHALTVGIVGLNMASHYLSFEGDRTYSTGAYGPHPMAEAPEAERRLRADAERCFDEFLILPFQATNEPPYPFAWVDPQRTNDEYASMVVRLLDRYEHL